MKEEFVIAETLPRQRLDVFLRERFPDLSRGAIQRLIISGEIRVDGNIVKPTHQPRPGEIIVVDQNEPLPDKAQGEDMPLDVLYEDADLLVLNKPAGLVVHPAAGHGEHTLVNALLHHCRGQLSGIGGVARPGIVHRLDKDTTGCIVAAKNDAAHMNLAAQFAGRTVTKTYQAIVCGSMTPAGGEINAPIARDPVHRKRMAVVTGKAKGRAARTSFRVLKKGLAMSWVELDLHTGRTHQIRVHLKHVGFPILGDEVYGSKATNRMGKAIGYKASRPLLHAWKLSFLLPSNSQRVTFEAPLPDDMQAALDFLK